jgi:hypothetical protein
VPRRGSTDDALVCELAEPPHRQHDVQVSLAKPPGRCAGDTAERPSVVSMLVSYNLFAAGKDCGNENVTTFQNATGVPANSASDLSHHARFGSRGNASGGESLGRARTFSRRREAPSLLRMGFGSGASVATIRGGRTS